MRIVLYIALLASVGCSINREYSVPGHKGEVFFYSTEKERTIGRNLAKAVANEYTMIKDPRDLERVERVTARLAAVSDRQEIRYYTEIIDSEIKNAFSVPGGYIFIFKGLMDALANDDELAFVISHELAHIVARHHIKRLQAAWGMNLLVLASSQAKGAGDLPLGVSNALVFILAGFAQDDELQADALAIQYAGKAGYDPTAAVTVLNKLWDFRKKDAAMPYQYVKTHPDVGVRIKSAKESMGLPIEFRDYLNSIR